MALKGISRSRASGVCVLVSGGIESVALIALSLKSGNIVYPVYVRGGHKWEAAELYWLKRLLKKLSSQNLRPLAILELPIRDAYRKAQWSLTGRHVPSARTRDESVYLPGRNVLLLAKASVFCAQRGLSRIALGTLASNPFPDASRTFFSRMAGALSMGLGASIKIRLPFGKLHKEQVMVRAGKVPFELTFSCIAPLARRHCGRCNKCAERRKAFRGAGIPDPTQYRRR